MLLLRALWFVTQKVGDPSDPRPFSDAAAALFDLSASTLGTLNKIDFESVALQQVDATGVAIGGGVTLSMTNPDLTLAYEGITDSTFLPMTLGYNTSASGTHFARMAPLLGQGITYTTAFSFTDPIQAFGAYFTGIDTFDGNVTINFNDGSNQVLTLTGQPGGGVQFWGITDPGTAISGISFSMTNITAFQRDLYGIDDFRFVNTEPSGAVVPLPSSLLAGLVLLASVAIARRAARSLRTRTMLAHD